MCGDRQQARPEMNDAMISSASWVTTTMIKVEVLTHRRMGCQCELYRYPTCVDSGRVRIRVERMGSN